MNISLTNHPEPNFGETMPSIQDEIEAHQGIMRNAGYAIVGPAVLVPEPGGDYPGSYQVWSPITFDEDPSGCWVYIDSEGVAIQSPHLPTVVEMETR